MSSWDFLDQKEEEELHKQRLLNFEEKPFKRITKRLSKLHSLASSHARQVATPPPENPAINGNGISIDDGHSPAPSTVEQSTAELAHLKEEITLDFAAFTSNIERLQLLLTANEKQRARYASERVRILATAQQVRDRNTALRVQLDQARDTLAQRKTFDDLADQITRNPNLRSRAEQTAALTRLEDEIAQLQAESETYAATWRERRGQFARIMDEAMRLRRQIRDEKEEVERREGMDDDAAGGPGTPAPTVTGGLHNGDGEGSQTPYPASTVGRQTPARDSPAPGGETHTSLKPVPNSLRALSPDPSRAGSRLPSRAGSHSDSRDPSPARVAPSERDDGDDDAHSSRHGEDVEMREAKGDVEMTAAKDDSNNSKHDDADMQDETDRKDDAHMTDDAEMTDSKGDRRVASAGEAGGTDTPDSPLTPVPEDPPQIVVEDENGNEEKMES